MSSGQSLTYALPTSNSYVAATTMFADSALLLVVPIQGYNLASLTLNPPTAASSSTTTISVSSTTRGTTSARPSTSTTSTSANTSGLSGGANAGIGVGVAVCALTLCAVVAASLFFRRRRRCANAPAELPSTGKKNIGILPEADSRPQRSEIDGSSRPVELQG